MDPIKNQNLDIQRLRQEYSHRAERLKTNNLYSSDNPAHQWMIADRHKNILEFLNLKLTRNLADLQILEIGCGSGGVIQEFIQSGAKPAGLTGVDLLIDRLEQASDDLPACFWVNADGQQIPFQDESFDLLLQFTAFSSILDSEIKKDMATEMLRTLKPGGNILWYDFIWNPNNPQTRGIGLREIKSLFTDCEFFPSRITLAPPLSRLLLPRFPQFADWLSALEIFNSHLLVWIQKPA